VRVFSYRGDSCKSVEVRGGGGVSEVSPFFYMVWV
jgi:hypothetical protein